MQIKITKKQMFQYLEADGPEQDDYAAFLRNVSGESLLTEDEFDALRQAEIVDIVASDTFDDLDGDSLMDVANSVVFAIDEGYTIYTWSGPDDERLIFGLKPGKIRVVQPI